MKEMRIFLSACVLFLGILNVGASTPGHHPINIIVILDTSDRISNDGQVESDIEIVKEIVTLFDDLVKRHLQQIDVSHESIGYPHRLSFVVPDQPRTPPIPPNLMRALEIRDPGAGEGYPEFERHIASLLSQVPKLYTFVQQSQQTGSDIWGWFQDEAHDYLRKGYQNRIICISDGYLIFDHDIQVQRPEGTCMHIQDGKIDMKTPLAPVDKGFTDYSVSFLMVEIDTKDQGDFENMKRYWGTWLEKMGIQETNFAKRGRWLPKIRLFILPE